MDRNALFTQKGYVENESETYLIQMAGRATGSDASFELSSPAPLHYGEDENDVRSLN